MHARRYFSFDFYVYRCTGYCSSSSLQVLSKNVCVLYSLFTALAATPITANTVAATATPSSSLNTQVVSIVHQN